MGIFGETHPAHHDEVESQAINDASAALVNKAKEAFDVQSTMNDEDRAFVAALEQADREHREMKQARPHNEIESASVDDASAAVMAKSSEASAAARDSLESAKNTASQKLSEAQDSAREAKRDLIESTGSFTQDLTRAFHEERDKVASDAQDVKNAAAQKKDEMADSLGSFTQDLKRSMDQNVAEAKDTMQDVKASAIEKKDEIKHAAAAKKDEVEYSLKHNEDIPEPTGSFAQDFAQHLEQHRDAAAAPVTTAPAHSTGSFSGDFAQHLEQQRQPRESADELAQDFKRSVNSNVEAAKDKAEELKDAAVEKKDEVKDAAVEKKDEIADRMRNAEGRPHPESTGSFTGDFAQSLEHRSEMEGVFPRAEGAARDLQQSFNSNVEAAKDKAEELKDAAVDKKDEVVSSMKQPEPEPEPTGSFSADFANFIPTAEPTLAAARRRSSNGLMSEAAHLE